LARTITDHPAGDVLLDPQFFLPHADHHRLIQHAYWPRDYDSGTFFDGPELAQMLRTLHQLNAELGCVAMVLPGLMAEEVDDDWLEVHKAIAEEAAHIASDWRRYPTFCLSSAATRSNEQIHRLLEEVETWQFPGCYVVFEHPRGDYLVGDPIWIGNTLDLVAGLKLMGKEVIVGYCNHQNLLLGAVHADAIATGTWMNVRSFPPEKFRQALEDEMRNRQVWYYCPQALSEYTLPFMDLAAEQGLLEEMQPRPPISDDYVAHLFAGTLPTTAGLTEQAAFRHYFHALRVQSGELTATSFDEACGAQESMLDEAARVTSVLRAGGIRGRLREFTDCIDANRAALQRLAASRGPMLRREWGRL